MSKHGEIRRYSLIIEKIIRGHYPGFREIGDYLHEHGFQVGDRTLQRDIEQIRYDFCIEIKYDRSKKGYCIDYENSLNLESFFTSSRSSIQPSCLPKASWKAKIPSNTYLLTREAD